MNDLTWIYVVTNSSFPKYVKVGWTRHNPHKRISDIDSTGVPTPFDLNYVACVEDAGRLEKLTHQFLDNYRVRSSREFFEVSAKFAREAIRSVALNFGVRFYFEKIYIEDECNVSGASSTNTHGALGVIDFKRVNIESASDISGSPSASIYERFGDIDFERINIEGEIDITGAPSATVNYEYDFFDDVHSGYASLVVKAFLDFDVSRGMNILLDYCKWVEEFPAVNDFFTDEEIVKYRVGVFKRIESDEDSINMVISDHLIDEFLSLAVDESSVWDLISWLALLLIPDEQAQRIARHYIVHGATSRVKLLAANYLFETVKYADEEVFLVYEAELKIDASMIREPSSYISFNQVLNQAFVRMCSILIESNCHEYDGFLRSYLDFLESSQSCFVRHYPELRDVMQRYFGGENFETRSPLIPYYKWLVVFEASA